MHYCGAAKTLLNVDDHRGRVLADQHHVVMRWTLAAFALPKHGIAVVLLAIDIFRWLKGLRAADALSTQHGYGILPIMTNIIRLPRVERGPGSGLDADAVRAAYRRWASVYDMLFGVVSSIARRRAVEEVNRLPGTRVLEVGVGTGLALPHYLPQKRIVGIDLSAEMLARARERVRTTELRNVEALHEMDAEATGFADASFDIAVAMFVASVVPHAHLLLAEMRRVVRPGGHILFVNHFAAERGPRWWLERAMAPASRALGWHPDFAMQALLGADAAACASIPKTIPVPPFGIFTLMHLAN